jgi:hypothetical protein
MLWRVLTIAGLALLVSVARCPNPNVTSQDGAELALEYLLEWAKWMAGIQTAALGGLALLLRSEDKAPRPMTDQQRFFALSAFTLLGLALFITAWILSSLPSLAVRMHEHPSPRVSERYDIYEQGLYGWMPSLKLAYFMTAQHWLWGLGLLSFGAFIVVTFASPSTALGSNQASEGAANPGPPADR